MNSKTINNYLNIYSYSDVSVIYPNLIRKIFHSTRFLLHYIYSLPNWIIPLIFILET